MPIRPSLRSPFRDYARAFPQPTLQTLCLSFDLAPQSLQVASEAVMRLLFFRLASRPLLFRRTLALDVPSARERYKIASSEVKPRNTTSAAWAPDELLFGERAATSVPPPLAGKTGADALTFLEAGRASAPVGTPATVSLSRARSIGQM